MWFMNQNRELLGQMAPPMTWNILHHLLRMKVARLMSDTGVLVRVEFATMICVLATKETGAKEVWVLEMGKHS